MKHVVHNDKSFRGVYHSFSGSKDEAKRLAGILIDNGIGFTYLVALPDHAVITEIPEWGFQEIMRVTGRSKTEKKIVEQENLSDEQPKLGLDGKFML